MVFKKCDKTQTQQKKLFLSSFIYPVDEIGLLSSPLSFITVEVPGRQSKNISFKRYDDFKATGVINDNGDDNKPISLTG